MAEVIRTTEGSLSDFFVGVAGKRLSAVETDGNVSHQHEFNATKVGRALFGEPGDPVSFPAHFAYLCDDDEEVVSADGILTWYDSRRGKADRSPEGRIYYVDNVATGCAEPGDGVIFARHKGGDVFVFLTECDSVIGDQLRWLFGLRDKDRGFDLATEFQHDELAFASRLVLERIGINVGTTSSDVAHDLVERFGYEFPTTREFSDYARSTVIELHPGDDGDDCIPAWMDQETMLFQTMENLMVQRKLDRGFESVDDFIRYSLSTQNRRKSRAGQALENHLEYFFCHREIRFTRTPTTERKNKPDFIFPGIDQYRDMSFNANLLTMLGAKTTLKDRWRQIEDEADRIPLKHLITLQPSVSTNQTDQMRAQSVQLVVPKPIQSSYTDDQRDWLMSVEDFVEHVYTNQRASEEFGASVL